jgi:hypothetical protein
MSDVLGRINFGGVSASEFKAKHSEEVEAVKRSESDAKKLLREYRSEHGKLEVFFHDLKGAISAMSPAKIVYENKSSVKVSSPCSVVCCMNDWHYGSMQNTEEIEGFGEYNSQICERRVGKYVNSILDWSALHRNSYTIDELVVLLLGDFISGDIHEELRVTNEFPVPIQSCGAGLLIGSAIKTLSAHFPKVRCEFIVADNHARLTKKPQAKEEGLNSLNYVVGFVAKQALSRQNNVEFNLYTMNEKVVAVKDRQYLISHGHGIIGWAGVPWYGIERKVGKESGARLQSIMEDITRSKQVGFHKYVFGHWHTPVSLPLYWGSASLAGTDAYDHKNGRYSKPSQAAWITHLKHGEFDRTDFSF